MVWGVGMRRGGKSRMIGKRDVWRSEDGLGYEEAKLGSENGLWGAEIEWRMRIGGGGSGVKIGWGEVKIGWGVG